MEVIVIPHRGFDPTDMPELSLADYQRAVADAGSPHDDESAKQVWRDLEAALLRDAVTVTIDRDDTGLVLRDRAFDKVATRHERKLVKNGQLAVFGKAAEFNRARPP